ncbi:MAG: hypothetical protein LCH63_03225 [Candidatus Melainabacteria bacterium]|jgi:hypothetical protein|uniref:Uncharacterized protein n=1 Tax=Candidatus Obscuribacter phosphatis TaxID=1906157 RepID=A0A8J7TKZ8_9BACT|nr:hypothetical protein [Candidatus Obscuribacter phosphatis]MCA0312836.1 hypothetical protein [Candidatus Melainabacteria bacterium]OPZ83201.1 MAG: hypothetical protein BWY75_03126 [bacterium ADurb.Bin425]
MFESFGRGLKLILASIKMGFQDKRLLIPGLMTVFSNFFFAILLFLEAKSRVAVEHSASAKAVSAGINMGKNALQHGNPADIQQLMAKTALNGPWDQGGLQGLSEAASPDAVLAVVAILSVWWLTNRFLEGVTTALVYSHLTEGSGSGRFSTACAAVFSSLPAIITLGIVTLIAKKVARFMRDKRSSGIFGMGINFIASIVEVFWTMAGHLILPAIVIEGTSFWGALKRADRIGQGNLIAIGVGEIGIDTINRLVMLAVCLVGVAGYGALYVYKIPANAPIVMIGGGLWAMAVVLTTAMSIYIRSAFFTCLYVWAIEAEALSEAERVNCQPPAPLAAALA